MLRHDLILTPNHFNSQHANAYLCPGDPSCPIVPVVIGDENKSSQFARHLLSEGVLAVSLAFPVVPKGQGWYNNHPVYHNPTPNLLKTI